LPDDIHAEISRASKLETRRVISNAIKVLAAMQHSDCRTLQQSTTLLEQKLIAAIEPLTLPRSTITVVVLTARYFLDLGQHSRVVEKSNPKTTTVDEENVAELAALTLKNFAVDDIEHILLQM
jgi:hypothetical protein